MIIFSCPMQAVKKSISITNHAGKWTRVGINTAPWNKWETIAIEPGDTGIFRVTEHDECVGIFLCGNSNNSINIHRDNTKHAFFVHNAQNVAKIRVSAE